MTFCLISVYRKKNNQKIASENNKSVAPPTAILKNVSVEFNVQTYTIDEFSEWISTFDANSIFFIAGSTTNSVLKHVCETCVKFLNLKNLPDIDYIKKAKFYANHLNKGGLKEPCKQTFCLVLHCEHYFNLYKQAVLRNGNSDLIKNIHKKVNITFPTCCNVKLRIIKHFFNVRSYCVKNFSENCKFRKTIYGSASKK